MTYWIYSWGLPVPVRTQQLLNKRLVQPLQAIAKNHQITDTDNNLIQPKIEKNNRVDNQRIGLNSAYKKHAENERQSVQNASDIMSSPVITLSKNMSFNAVWQKFQDFRFRHFPIVNEDKQLIGIVSDRDMLASFAHMGKENKLINENETISKTMITAVLTASCDTSIHEICQVMFSQHIGALPIINEDSVLVGLITRSDILRTIIKNEAMEFWI